MIIFSQGWDTSWNDKVMELARAAGAHQVRVIVASASADKAREQVQVPVMKSDLVAIKTAARTDPTIYLIENATIKGKWALTDMDKALEELKK